MKNMKIKPKDIKVGVHPVSHKFEWESRGKWGGYYLPPSAPPTTSVRTVY